MKHTRVFIKSQRFLIIICGMLFAFASAAFIPHVFAQKNIARDAAATRTSANTTTRDDNSYSAKIKEYTTAPYFLTELVDHLPMSETVPSPDKILGHIVGAPDKLTYSQDIYRYYRELAKASPRVRGAAIEIDESALPSIW